MLRSAVQIREVALEKLQDLNQGCVKGKLPLLYLFEKWL